MILHYEWHEIEFFLDQQFQEEEEEQVGIGGGGDSRCRWSGFVAVVRGDDGRV